MMDKTITLKAVQIGAIAHRLKEGLCCIASPFPAC